MRDVASVYKTPSVPAVYAMYGGTGSGVYVAYVGSAGELTSRLIQHFVRRDSSAVTGRSAVGLNPDFITEVRWRQHPDFCQPDSWVLLNSWRSTCLTQP